MISQFTRKPCYKNMVLTGQCLFQQRKILEYSVTNYAPGNSQNLREHNFFYNKTHAKKNSEN